MCSESEIPCYCVEYTKPYSHKQPRKIVKLNVVRAIGTAVYNLHTLNFNEVTPVGLSARKNSGNYEKLIDGCMLGFCAI